MRRISQRALQTKCVHAGAPFHAGHAVFAAVYHRGLSTTPRRHQKNRPEIRWFEQTGRDPKSVQPFEDDIFNDDLDDVALEEEELSDVEKELLKLGAEEVDELDGEPSQLIDRARSLGLMSDDGESFDLHSLEMNFQLPQLLKRRIESFNKAIKESASDLHHLEKRRVLWTSYMRCKQSIPGFLDQISHDAWKVLWRSQSAQPFFNEQASHILAIANDIYKVGRTLTPAQKLTRIKALEAAGETDEAVKRWYLDRKEMEADGNLRYESAALGVTLECAMQRPRRAQDLAFQHMGKRIQNLSSVRLLIPVISAWAREGSELGLKQAWALYLLLRRSFASSNTEKHSMTSTDYDQIYLGFFDAGRPDLALAVFKDLVLVGQDSPHDSLRLFKDFGQVLDSLYRAAQDAEDVNAISIDILGRLPKRFETRYFYASWMKRLIGLGRVETAASVVELMYERGIQPDPKHINGIVGAWLRGGDPKNQSTALELGWAMVRERLTLVARRRGLQDGQIEIDHQALQGVASSSKTPRQVPPATTETFCLLLLYYSEKRMSSYVEKVQQLLSAAELPANSYFMNHLMYSHVYQGQIPKAWELFNRMSEQVKPDMTTFSCLWDCARRMFNKYEQVDQFPAPRRLFSAMMDWWSHISAKDQEIAREDFNVDLYRQILNVFCTYKDLKGTLVALYALRDTFEAYPDNDVMRAVTIQIAQIGQVRQAGHVQGRPRVRRRRASSDDFGRNIDQASKLLEMVLQNRAAELKAQNLKVDALDRTQRGEESLWVLAEVLRAAQRGLAGSVASSEEVTELSEEVDKVAWEMGAGPFRMGPPTYGRQEHYV